MGSFAQAQAQLEAVFDSHHGSLNAVDRFVRQALEAELGLSSRQLQQWFGHRRSEARKWRRQQLQEWQPQQEWQPEETGAWEHIESWSPQLGSVGVGIDGGSDCGSSGFTTLMARLPLMHGPGRQRRRSQGVNGSAGGIDSDSNGDSSDGDSDSDSFCGSENSSAADEAAAALGFANQEAMLPDQQDHQNGSDTMISCEYNIGEWSRRTSEED